MKLVFIPLLLSTISISALAAERVPMSKKIDESKAKSAFAVEQRSSEKPLRIEQDCPSPEMSDLIKNSQWNTLEMGVSFQLGEGLGEVKPYSRYTCPSPKVPAP